MSHAIANLQSALQRALAVRPQVGGFPTLAETLRVAGVRRNQWSLPSCQALYLTELGAVVIQGEPLLSGCAEVADFDAAALVRALRADQSGASTFPEFLQAAWRAGVVRYDVDLLARNVTYLGSNGERYVEDYPAVTLPA
jgi:uncharacterized protein YbcV (DUF1398 family)